MLKQRKAEMYKTKPQVPKFKTGDTIRIPRWQIENVTIKKIKLQDEQFYYYFDYVDFNGELLELYCLECFIVPVVV